MQFVHHKPQMDFQNIEPGPLDDKSLTNDLMYGAVSCNRNGDTHWLTVKVMRCTFFTKTVSFWGQIKIKQMRLSWILIIYVL